MSLRRPILKCVLTGDSQPEISSFRAGHVHFPPTPEISATYIAHSARTYDRSAIVVSPNVCSLPRRHCPDRTYVLTEGKGEARLLKSVQAKDMQGDGEDVDVDYHDTPCVEGQGAMWLDYFSIPSSSSTSKMVWSESDDSDELVSLSNEMDLNCDHSKISTLAFAVHNTQAHEASEPQEYVQAALAFLPLPRPPAIEQERNVSLRDGESQDEPHAYLGGESSHAPLTRSRRPRRASTFTTDVPPDLGCLGGF